MRIALTGQGVRFILLLCIVAFAAYNNQNNLLYLMASVGLASVLVCALAGWASLRGLAFVSAEAPDAYANVPFRERLLLTSTARALGAFGVDVESGADSIPFIEPGSRGASHVERLYRRRGRYRGESVEVATRFPFGFFRLRRRLAAPRDILVFPRIRRVDPAVLKASHSGVLARTQRRGRGDEFFRLREYVPGDHVHHIHWKSSAKLNDVMVREFGEDEEERLCLGFSPVFIDEEDTSEFEHLVSGAASLATHLASSGVRFRFLAEDLDLPPSRSREHTRRILTYLAEVQPARAPHPVFTANAVRASASGENLFVVTLERELGIGTALDPRTILRPRP